MQAAEESCEEVALGGGVSVSWVATAVVVGAGTGRGAEGGERPAVARGVEAVVLDASVKHGPGLAAGTRDRRRASVGLESLGVMEPRPVIADLGQDAGAGQRTEPGEAGDDRGVRVLLEGLGGGMLEIVRGSAAGVELPEQGQRLTAHGLLDSGKLPHLRLAESLTQPGRLADDAASATSPTQQRLQLASVELRGRSRVRSGRQDRARLGPVDPSPRLGERGEEARVVLAQV